MNRELVESGIEWIGKYPSCWKLLPLRGLVKNINEKNNPIKFTNVLSLTNTRGVIPYEEKGNQGNISKEDLTQYKIAYKDTVIVNSMNLKIGSVGYSNYDGCVSPVYYVLASNEKSNTKFINYLFQSDFQKYLSKFGKGILEIREKIPMYDVLHSYVPVPSLFEQERIAKYLEENCSKIDNIISDNNKEIELLEEYKKNYSTEIFTKLLSNHSSIKIKKICNKISKGETPKDMSNEFNDNYCYRFLKCENIVNRKVMKEPLFTITSSTYDNMKRSQLESNDILFVIAGATIGKTAILTEDVLPANTNQAISFIRLIDKSNINVKYVEHFLNTRFIDDIILLNSVQSAQPNISMEDLGNIKIPIVELEEKEKIVNEIEKITEKINKVIEYRKKIINKLEEYKKSLIYEYVTGKKEVK